MSSVGGAGGGASLRRDLAGRPFAKGGSRAVRDRLLSQAAPMARDLWLSSLPGDGELPQARPSPAFQRRMDRLIRRMGRSPRRVRALAQVRRAAAVALVFLAVGFSGLMVTSQAFRAQVLEVLTQITEDFSYFFFFCIYFTLFLYFDTIIPFST